MNIQDNEDFIIDENACDCDEDNKCGCTYPNNVREFACGCTPEENCGCIKFDTESKQYYHDESVCSCTSKGECNCHRD